MKRLSVLIFVSSLVTLVTAWDTEAHGRRRGGDHCCDVDSCAPAAPIQYEERKVTRYKSVMVEREIEEIICKRVAREEKFNYTIQVPTTKQETRKQTFYKNVQKEVPYTYTVQVPVTAQENRKVTSYRRVEKEVPYTYTVMVPRTVQEKVKQTTYHCTYETVMESVPVCRLVYVNAVDECGRCYTRCERVTTTEKVARTIAKRVPITQDVVVNRVVCEAQNRQGTMTRCDFVPEVRDVVVNVCRYQTQSRQATRIVCELVPEVRDVTIQLCSFATQQREGTRTVYDIVQEKVKRKVQVCQLQPYEETIRVAVGCGGCGR